MILFLAVAATAQTNLSDAEIQGRQLAKQLYWAKPETNFVQNGILSIRDSNGNKTNIPVSFKAQIAETNWKTGYFREGTNAWINGWIIIHQEGQENRYVRAEQNSDANVWNSTAFLHLNGNEAAIPFAGSDFWVCDLGLEFFHWPEQKILRKEFARGRGCEVLESTNPNPSPNGYSRVDSWIDEETLGIVQAKAYDARGELLKTFEPKSFKKINGQWELQDMEIRNVQTGSRTQIKFDLKPD